MVNDANTDLISLAKRFPLCKVPTLEVDGRIICQSSAINRYLATEFKLYGADNEERVIIDQVCETLKDVIQNSTSVMISKESEEKKVFLGLQ